MSFYSIKIYSISKNETAYAGLEFYKMNDIISTVLFVAFVIVCVFIVLLVLVQDDGQNGMGGLLGGRGTAAFGSHSANVLTKASAVFVTLFFVIALSLAMLNSKPTVSADMSETTGVTAVETTVPAEAAE